MPQHDTQVLTDEVARRGRSTTIPASTTSHSKLTLQGRSFVRHSLHTGRRRLIGLLATGALVTGAIAASPVQAAPSVGTTKADDASSGKTHNDNLRSPLAVKQDALRQKALEKRLKGDASAQGKVAKLGPGTARPARARGHRQDLRRHRGVRRPAVPRNPHLPGHRRRTAAPPTSRDRATTRSRPRTVPWTTRPCGRRTTTGRTTRTCTSTGWRSTTSASPRAATRSRVTSPSGSRCPSTRRSTAATTAAASSATPRRPSCVTPSPSGSRASSTPARR